jgi:hypothetical protein
MDEKKQYEEQNMPIRVIELKELFLKEKDILEVSNSNDLFYIALRAFGNLEPVIYSYDGGYYIMTEAAAYVYKGKITLEEEKNDEESKQE